MTKICTQVPAGFPEQDNIDNDHTEDGDFETDTDRIADELLDLVEDEYEVTDQVMWMSFTVAQCAPRNYTSLWQTRTSI